MAEKSAASLMKRPIWMRTAGVVLAVIVLINLALAFYWSRSPSVFWVNDYQENGEHLVGYSTTDTLVRVAETLLR